MLDDTPRETPEETPTPDNTDPPRCRDCGSLLDVLLLMGRVPDYLICDKCSLVYAPYTLQCVGTVVHSAEYWRPETDTPDGVGPGSDTRSETDR